MLRLSELRSATDYVTSAAVSGHGWEAALQRFADAAGAFSATLARTRHGQTTACLFSTNLQHMRSPYLTGDRPVDSRAKRVLTSQSEGFRVDLQDFTARELAHDPYYQEFLRPCGIFWHGCARLETSSGVEIDISLKRDQRSGCFDASDIAVLDQALPDLRACARIARNGLDAGARAVAGVLANRGDPVYQFDRAGRVLRVSRAAEADTGLPVTLVGRRLKSRDRAVQEALEHAIAQCATGLRSSSLVRLSRDAQPRHFLQIVALKGEAQDILSAASAVGVLIDARASPVGPEQFRTVFGLTDREAALLELVAGGLDLPEAARHMGIGKGTARSYLKHIFEKCGVRRQSELAALIGRLRP